MSEVRKVPCSACPYRCDVPSGVWSHEEYEKLRPYDGATYEQPPNAFACHATPGKLCHGWAVVSGEDSLALRLTMMRAGERIEVPEAAVPLFGSHTEAADHGQADVERPGERAQEVVDRLQRKHERLRERAGEAGRRSR